MWLILSQALFYNSRKMDRKRFEGLVAAAVAGLPEPLRDLLENVDVVVQDLPSRAQNRQAAGSGTLLGLYEGVPLTGRGNGYNMVVPDKITIFQNAIESAFASDSEIEREVRQVVWHEIAHHFGLDDHRLEQIEAERRSKHRRS
jgi:predicted Zn-dependent protease with MMP-like domain